MPKNFGQLPSFLLGLCNVAFVLWHHGHFHVAWIPVPQRMLSSVLFLTHLTTVLVASHNPPPPPVYMYTYGQHLTDTGAQRPSQDLQGNEVTHGLLLPV